MTNLSGANLNSGAAVGLQGESRESPSGFPKYPEYKSSGIEWLGVVPEHWIITKFSRLFSVRMGETIPETELSDDGWLPVYSATERDKFYGYVNERKPLVKKGDLVIPARGNSIGFVKLVREKATATQTTIVANILNNETIDSAYSYYWCLGLRKILFHFDRTAIPQITTEYVSQNPILLPVYEEQTQIARFLDHETARIDALIEEQQRLIELLKEKRQAVISHAVTKGLDPTVPMKDSGVEWLGEVPAHWIVSRVKNIASFITSGSRGWSDYIDESGEDIFLQSGDMDNRLNVLLDKAKRISTPEGAEGVRTRLQNGDVVVCITGANTGRVAVLGELNQAAYVNQHLGLVRPHMLTCNSRYLGYALSSISCQSYFNVEQYGLKEGLSLTDLAEAPLIVPPLVEQVQLIDVIENILVNLDGLTADSEIIVGLLQERRSALISAAVTGKIDVRGWQPLANAVSPELVQEAV